jgi:glycosyltransferase 2 family protein
MHQPLSTKTGEQPAQPSQASQTRVDLFIGNKTHTSFRKVLWSTFKILAGLTLLILSIQGIHFENLVEGIQAANLTWLFLAIVSVITGLLLKFLRWQIFLKNCHIQADLSMTYKAYFLGQAVNILSPLRAGEAVRMGYFAKDPHHLPEVALTIALEKYMDLVALAVCGILVSLRLSLENILNLKGVLLPLTTFASLILLSGVLFGPSAWAKIRVFQGIPTGVKSWVDRWVQSSLWLRKPEQVLPGIILTLIIWGVMWLTNLLLFKSFALPLGGTAAGFVLITVYVGLLPALMPGNVGPFYFFARLALIPFGVIHDVAFTYAVVLHAIVTLPPLIGGAISLLTSSPRPSRS